MPDLDLIKVVGVGDIMLGRGVHDLDMQNLAAILSPDVADCLEGDIVTGNLECLIGKQGTPNPFSHVHFQGCPVRSEYLLKKFDVVSLANNHINDFGDEAIDETISELTNMGVAYVGIGRSFAEACEPKLYDIRNNKIAIFAATTVSPLTSGNKYVAAIPGEQLYSSIKAEKDRGSICILHLHSGGGDFDHPAPFVSKLMREISECEVDLVLGHHPHAVQGMQLINDTSVFYSLGDFIFDKVSSGRCNALIVEATISAEKKAMETIDFFTVVREANLQISLLTGTEEKIFRNKVIKLSEKIEDGSYKDAYYKCFGNPLVTLGKNVLKDLSAGGLRALWAKIMRVDRHRLTMLMGSLFRTWK